MGRTKRDFMETEIYKYLTINGVPVNDYTIQRMKEAEAEWEEINREQSLSWWANVWKYFHNLHTRKSRKNTLNGRKT